MNIAGIVERLDQRLERARNEIASLEAARHILLAPEAKTVRQIRNGETTFHQRRKRQRRRQVVPPDKLEALLGSIDGEGITTSALAAQADADGNQVLSLLKELETAGKVRRSGERRTTRWHLITEEDLVAPRARELEARRKR